MEIDYKTQHTGPLSPVQRLMGQTALATVVCMMSAILLNLVLWVPLNYVFKLSESTQGAIFAITFLIGHTISGVFWGRYIAQITQSEHTKRLMIVAALVFVPTLIVNYGVIPTVLEAFSYERLPTHQEYLLIFLPFVFIVSAVYTGAVGLADAKGVAALRNALVVALCSTGSFLVVVLIMDAIGYRVGALRSGLWPPLPPMPTVTLLATLIGSCVGGAIFGWCLYNDSNETHYQSDYLTEHHNKTKSQNG